MTNQNGFHPYIHQLLPVEQLQKAGRELETLNDVQEFARSQARAIRNAPYDQVANPDDKLREEKFLKDSADLKDFEIASAHALTNVKDGERRAAELQKGMQEPKLPLKITTTGISLIAVSLGPTLHDQFFSTMDDQVFAWIISMSGGALIGAFITHCVAGVYDSTGQRSTVNLVGLVGGFGIGVAGLLIRLAAGDLLIGLALTILEFAAVAMLELYAAPLRDRYRQFVAARESHHQATKVLDSLNTESGRRSQQLAEIRDRIEQHKGYVALRTFAHQKFAELEEAAIQIATKAFREKEAEDRRLREQAEQQERNRRLGLV